MDVVAEVVASIRAAKLPPEVYRTARELLDLAGENGQVRISKQAMMDICETESEGTMRRQLGILKKAGLIHASTNEHVHISFLGFPTVDGARTARAPVITPRAPTRVPCADDDAQPPYENEPPRTARAPVITPRAPTRVPCALPHTRGVSLFVSTNHPIQNAEQTNKPTRPGPKRAPWEAPASFQLLTDKRVAMGSRVANRLAAHHSFWEIRDAVAHWYIGRELVGGKFENTCGIVIKWLDNPDEFTIPTLSDEFRRCELYRDHRTPDEKAAEQAALDEALRQEEQRQADPPEEQPADGQDVNDEPEPGSPEARWQQVKWELQLEQGGTFNRWVNDTHVISYEEESNAFLIALPDAYRYDWIVHRLSKQIKRKLAAISGRPAEVKFKVITPGSAGTGEVNDG